MPPHFVQGAGIGTGSAAVATVPHVEQSQLRLRMRSSGRTISSGGPRRSITSRSVFMAQDVGEITRDCHQPSRLSRCGEARHHRRHELAPRFRARKDSLVHVAAALKLLDPDYDADTIPP
jgi:hypothetical protein